MKKKIFLIHSGSHKLIISRYFSVQTRNFSASKKKSPQERILWTLLQITLSSVYEKCMLFEISNWDIQLWAKSQVVMIWCSRFICIANSSDKRVWTVILLYLKLLPSPLGHVDLKNTSSVAYWGHFRDQYIDLGAQSLEPDKYF